MWMTFALFNCIYIIPKTSAQIHDLEDIEVNGDTMYMYISTDSMRDKKFTRMHFYYNTDTAMVHFKYVYHNENSKKDFVAYMVSDALMDDLSRSAEGEVPTKDNNVRHIGAVINDTLADILSTDEWECIKYISDKTTSNTLYENPINVGFYIDFDGKIVNIELQILSQLYGPCLNDARIHEFLKGAMGLNLKFPRYVHQVNANADFLKQYRDKWRFWFYIWLRPRMVKFGDQEKIK